MGIVDLMKLLSDWRIRYIGKLSSVERSEEFKINYGVLGALSLSLSLSSLCARSGEHE